MIFDEVAEVMNRDTARKIEDKTGLHHDKVRRMANGLPFVMDYNTYFALQKLGYDVKIIPKN